MNIFKCKNLIPVLLILALGCNPTKKAQVSQVDRQKSSAVTTIAFGSCNRQDKPQPLWEPILSQKPDVFIWLGDIIYGDTEDMGLLKSKYDMQTQQDDYEKLATTTSVIGVWDDHDYGKNDAGKEYPKKKESRELLYNFLDIPVASPLREREGAYSAHLYGKLEEKVKVILLDARYFRDALEKDAERAYIPNTSGSILGEAQWAWLETELEKKDAAITLIGSGIQMIPQDHPYEKWENFPQERQRLLDLLAKTKPNGVLLLSGDRHIAEISKLSLQGLSHPLYDVTSSGLTHTWNEYREEPNQHRVGDMIAKLNFGLLHFTWEPNQVKVKMEIRGEDNILYLTEELIVKK